MFVLFKIKRQKYFWKLRKYFVDKVFALNKNQAALDIWRKDARADLGNIKELIFPILGSLLWPLLLLLALIFLEKELKLIVSPSLVELSGLNIKQIESGINSSTFEQLLNTIAQIMSVFVGLYFTAFGVMVGAVFTKVPDRVRYLLIKDRIGNVYTKNLLQITAFSLLLYGYRIFIGSQGILNTAVLILVGCFGIFTFIPLGLRIFALMSKIKIVDTVLEDALDAIKKIQPGGFGWKNPNFQNHYHTIVSYDLESLEALLDLSYSDQQLGKQDFVTIFNKLKILLKQSQRVKRKVPTSSKWYPSKEVHKNFFLQSYETQVMALSTQYTQPELISDIFWFEERIFTLLEAYLNKIFDSQAPSEKTAIDLCNYLYDFFEEMSKNLETKKALEYLRRLNTIIVDFALVPDNPDGKNERLSLIDIVGMNFVSLGLGLIKQIIETDIEQQIDKIDWLDGSSMYSGLFPSKVLSQLEYIQEKIQFEQSVEGSIISPEWYLKQLIIKRYREMVKDGVSDLFVALGDMVEIGNKLTDKGLYLLSIHQNQRTLEFIGKLSANWPRLKESVSKLDAMMIEKALAVTEWDWEGQKNEMDDKWDDVVSTMAKCIPGLSSIQRKDDLPDFFGQTYSRICEDCYNALAKNNIEKFKSLFPSVFFGALVSFYNLRDELSNLKTENSLPLAFEPLADILELSGYSFMYAELYSQPSLWNFCKEQWDRYFSLTEKVIDAKTLLVFYNFKKGLFSISPRDPIRTHWSSRFFGEMYKMLGIDGDDFEGGEARIPHPSKIISKFAGFGSFMSLPVSEIFIYSYLSKQPGADEVEVSDTHELASIFAEESDNV